MRKLQQLKSTSLLLFVAILGSTWGAQRAYADTVSEFTGTWPVNTLSSLLPGYAGTDQDESTSGRPIFFDNFGADGSHEAEFISVPVTAGTLRPGCDVFGFSCPGPVSWGGTFVGGIMDMFLDTDDSLTPTMTATITGGSYSGFNNGLVDSFTETDDEQTFTFTGQWSNGWTSVGTFSGGYGQDGDILGGSGSLTMTTTTAPTTVPEPGSMTLLGTGMVLAAAFLRLRLRNSSPVL
jgi:PEP-CTERM motif